MDIRNNRTHEPDFMIEVRQATLDDKPAIFEFIKKAYAGRSDYKIPKRWAWAYINNPFKETDHLPIWIAVAADGQVVGQTCALIEPLKLGEYEHRVGWSVDTFLLPAYRGQRIGFRLQQANHEANPIFMSLSMSAANRRIKISLGSKPLPPVTAFERPVRYRPEAVLVALDERLAAIPARMRRSLLSLTRALRGQHALAAAATWRAGRRDASWRAAMSPAVQIRQVDIFPAESDQLWAQLAPHFFGVIRRDQQYLDWKYVQQPHTDYQIYIAYRGGQIQGHLVLRLGHPPEPKVGIIADLFAAPDDREMIDKLVAFGIQRLRTAGAVFLSAASSVPAYQAAFRRQDFKKTKDVVPMIHCHPGSAGDPEPQSGLWLLGRGDHDWDQVPNA
jgi:GNAT superfamily N-acetyltransferase